MLEAADWSRNDLQYDIAAFNIRTAEIIKRVIPDARIAGLVLCRPRAESWPRSSRAISGLPVSSPAVKKFDLSRWSQGIVPTDQDARAAGRG